MRERERWHVQALSPADQVRMAMHALSGWTFSLRAAGTWLAARAGYFHQYGRSLSACLDQIDNAVLRRRMDERLWKSGYGGKHDRR